MFDLNKEVETWCEAVLGDNCGQSDRMDELQDHLFSEIGRNQKQGLSEKEAFLKATERLGDTEQLGAEFAKNRSVLATIYAWEKKGLRNSAENSRFTIRQIAAMNIGVSLIFALAMIAAPFLLENKDQAQTVIFAVLLPLWFTLYMLLPGTRQSMACEWRYLRRLVNGRR